MAVAITPLTQVSNLLVTLNSSVNFIIYIIYGEKFQRLFLMIFCKRHQGREQILRRYTTSTYHGHQASANGHHSRGHRTAPVNVIIQNTILKYFFLDWGSFSIFDHNIANES